MISFLGFVLLLGVGISAPVEEDSILEPVVKTTLGEIKGFTDEFNGVSIDTFLGVPFAKPPVGNLRFKPPEPATMWKNTLETLSMPYTCPQSLIEYFPSNFRGEAMWNSKTELKEDCLYLNIWLPSNRVMEAPLTTMVWIYGGGFYSGGTALDVYEGKYLAARNDVIVVSLNYRLGPLGFLFFDDEHFQGNMGLLDQNLALKWIYDNIDAFGGDPQKITLFGESAGSASVHYHMLSQNSWNYFSSVVMQSASAISPWAHTSRAEANSNSIKLAKLMGCYNSTDVDSTIECLQTKTADELVMRQWYIKVDNPSYMSVPFKPTTDGKFIKDTPLNLVLSRQYKKVPMLMGVNKNEASYFLLYDLIQAAQLNNSMTNLLEALPYVPSEMSNRKDFIQYIPRITHPGMNNVVLKSILHEYDTQFPTETPQQNIDIADDIGGDYSFKCPTISVAKEATLDWSRTPEQGIYLYSFNHRTCTNPWPAWAGVLHGDEIEYVFGMPLKDPHYTKEEKVLSGHMMDFWTNFAKTGNPNTDVLPVEEGPMDVGRNFVNHVNTAPQKRDTSKAEERIETPDIEELPVPDETEQETATLTVTVKTGTPPILEIHKPAPRPNIYWPKYTAAEEHYIVFGDGQTITTNTGLKHRECMFWGRIFPDLMKLSEKQCPEEEKN